MAKERKSVLVRTDPVQCVSSDLDGSVDNNRPIVDDADESSIVTFENEKFPKPKPRKYESDGSSKDDYYAMKSKGLSSQYRRPCKIEFQMVNANMKHKLRCNSRYHYGCQPCECMNCFPHHLQQMPSTYTINPHISSMNAQCNNVNFANDPAVVNIPAENYEAPKPESKIRRAFSCFASGPGSDDQLEENDKNEEDQNENNDEEKDEDEKQKTEYYHFDHGEFNYFYTTDKAPQLAADNANEKVYNRATRFWAEFFGSINVGVTFFLVFFLQLYRFILYSIIRSIVVGFLQMSSDYLLKPILASSFNGYIQPVLLFLRNIFQSIWNTVEPLAQMLLGICLPFIECLRAIRIVDVYYNTSGHGSSIHRKSSREESIV